MSFINPKGYIREQIFYIKTLVEAVNRNKGSLDIAVLAFAYMQALEELKKLGVTKFDVIVYDGKKHDVDIYKHIDEVNNFIKRKIILDLQNKEAVQRAVDEKRFVS